MKTNLKLKDLIKSGTDKIISCSFCISKQFCIIHKETKEFEKKIESIMKFNASEMTEKQMQNMQTGIKKSIAENCQSFVNEIRIHIEKEKEKLNILHDPSNN